MIPHPCRTAALALAFGVLPAVTPAQMPAWPDRCHDLVAAGMPAATVKTFFEAMQAAGNTGSLAPQQTVTRAAEIAGRFPQSLIVGISLPRVEYLPATGEIELDYIQTARVLLPSTPTERIVDVTVVIHEDLHAPTDYALTVVANVTVAPSDFGPDWPTQDGRHRVKGKDGGYRFKIASADAALGGHLRLLVAGPPRAPFTQRIVTPPPAGQGAVEGQRKIAFIEPICTAIVDARNGQAVHVIPSLTGRQRP
ncbi:hypothetical protein FHP25_17050 [Vineibacter terrae]|uniref:Uncharacterized protein n=1 Tax=Vineibacter terrae TaxID=2586908 RepID=A0A5C8PLS9_9HYPH|nr:hypothetical protein [Vineibacter terrae]TXL74469.1 hypothetical protein FHP25_17050 [Vineibacter terrae]